MTIEEAMAQQFALILMQPIQDQYGNHQQSPLQKALNEWAVANKKEIATLVEKNIKASDFADKVATQVMEELRNSYRPDSESLKKDVRKIMAEKLAEKYLAEKEEENV